MVNYNYDAVIILGGNIAKVGNDSFRSSSYADSDEFGMLGGRLRVDAAAWLFVYREARCFIFSTGTSEKTKKKYGSSLPTEARLYSEEFKAYLRDLRTTQPQLAKLSPPQIVLEEKSTNTRTNIEECFKLIRARGWLKVAVVSSWWHMPRVEAICKLVQNINPVEAKLIFLAAEDILKTLRPGEYDDEIEQAYKSPEAVRRFKSEAHGVKDLESGMYASGEYQLQPNHYSPDQDNTLNNPAK